LTFFFCTVLLVWFYYNIHIEVCDFIITYKVFNNVTQLGEDNEIWY
jgi:hypothetical protein